MNVPIMKILRSIKKNTAPSDLPLDGLLHIDDPDDITRWVMDLSYPDNNITVVRVIVQFNDGWYPHCFVVHPRLASSFLHHGMICFALMGSPTWKLNEESVRKYLLTVHDMLCPSHPDITLDLAGGPHYTPAEHAAGVVHIKKHHPMWFPNATPLALPPPPTTSSVGVTDTEEDQEEQHVCYDLEEALATNVRVVLLEKSMALESPLRVNHRVAVHGRDQPHLDVRSATFSVDGIQWDGVDFFDCSVEVSHGATTLRNCKISCSNTELCVLTVRGPTARLELNNVTVHGTVVVENGATLMSTDCVFTYASNACQKAHVRVTHPGTTLVMDGKTSVTSSGFFDHTLALGNGASATLEGTVLTSEAMVSCVAVEHSTLTIRDASFSTVTTAVSVSHEGATCEIASTRMECTGESAVGVHAIQIQLGATGAVHGTSFEKYDCGVCILDTVLPPIRVSECSMKSVRIGVSISNGVCHVYNCDIEAVEYGMFAMNRSKCTATDGKVHSENHCIGAHVSSAVTCTGMFIEGKEGSAVFCSGKATIALCDCTVTGKTGVEVNDSTCTIENCAVNARAKAIWVVHGATCVISDNDATKNRKIHSEITGIEAHQASVVTCNGVCVEGGPTGAAADYNTSCIVVLRNCTFDGLNGIQVNASTCTIENCSVNAREKAIYLLHGATCSVTNDDASQERKIHSEVTGIEAHASILMCTGIAVGTNSGSACFCFGGSNVELRCCIFVGCNGVKVEASTCTIVDCSIDAREKALLVSHGATVTVTDGKIRSEINGIDAQASVVTCTGIRAEVKTGIAAFCHSRCEIHLRHCTFVGFNGVLVDASTCVIQNCSVEALQVGIFAYNGSTLSVSDDDKKERKIRSGTNGIEVDSAVVTCTGIFVEQHGLSQGAGVFCRGNASNITLRHCTVVGLNGIQINASTCTIENCSVNARVKAIYLLHGATCSVTNDDASQERKIHSEITGIEAHASNVTCTGIVVEGNIAFFCFDRSKVNLRRCTFVGCIGVKIEASTCAMETCSTEALQAAILACHGSTCSVKDDGTNTRKIRSAVFGIEAVASRVEHSGTTVEAPHVFVAREGGTIDLQSTDNWCAPF